MLPIKHLPAFFGSCIIFLLLFSFSLLGENEKAATYTTGDQYVFFYENNILAYSDIQKLYSDDTSAERKVFFGNINLQEFKMHITATVKETIVKADERGWLSAFEILTPKIEVEGSFNTLDTSTLKKEIPKPVYAEYAANGRIISIRIDSSISFFTERFVKDIVSHFQFVKNDEDQKEWIANEDNINGEYRAKYKFLEIKDGFFKYEKEKIGYVKLVLAEKSQHVEVESAGNVTLDSNGIFNACNVSETEYSIFGNDTVSAGGTKYSIATTQHQKTTKDKIGILLDLSGSTAYSKKGTINAVHSKQEIRESAYRNTLSNNNFEELKAKLSFKLDSASADKLVLQFRALGYLFPDQCTEIAKLLESSSYGSQPYTILLTALSQVETSVSTNVMVEVLSKRRKETKVVGDLLRFFALTKSPTIEAAEIVREIAFDKSTISSVRSTAQLALGGIAYNFRKINPEESIKISAILYNDSLYLGQDNLQRILCLANTGSILAFPFFKKCSIDTTLPLEIRAQAVYSVKLIESDTVNLFLSQMLIDKDSIISKSAEAAIAFRNRYLLNN